MRKWIVACAGKTTDKTVATFAALTGLARTSTTFTELTKTLLYRLILMLVTPLSLAGCEGHHPNWLY